MKGLSKTRLYSIYCGMKSRCYNQNDSHYSRYGGRGISICEDWTGENGLNNFMEWSLGNGYEEHLTIDRIDNDGAYAPDNCRWVTQSINSSRANSATIKVEADEKLSAEQKIKTAATYKGISQAKLAALIGMTASNFNQKLKRATFTEEELQKIADALGASYVPFYFEFPGGMRI